MMYGKKIYGFLLIAVMAVSFCSCGEGGRKWADGSPAGQKLMETGELAAVSSQAFIVKRYSRFWFNTKIIGLLPHGEQVQPGDSIMQLDVTDVNTYISNRETELETQQANLEKLIVDQQNNINTLESAIKSATADFEIRKIGMEAVRFESERNRRIKELEFEQAKITFEKEKRKLELTKIINECDLMVQQVRVEQIKSEVEGLHAILPDFTMRTPVEGVFQIARNWNDAMFKVGDNVYPGMNVANVPELKYMKVNTFINENDFLKIKEGQKVAVRLDAMPKLVFDGEISYVGKLCIPKIGNPRQKVFNVEVRILEPDERLKPGMTVSCEFLP